MSSPIKLYPSIAAIGENTDRLAALYSPFRSKSLNPEHYDEKQKFWVKGNKGTILLESPKGNPTNVERFIEDVSLKLFYF